MKTTAQIELESEIETRLQNMQKILSDSPISFRSHKNQFIGFYRGFCDAKEWVVDLEFVSKIESLKVFDN